MVMRRIHQKRRSALVASSLLILSTIFYNPIGYTSASSRKSVPFTPKPEENVAFRKRDEDNVTKQSQKAADQNHRRRKKSLKSLKDSEGRKNIKPSTVEKRSKLSKYFDNDHLDDYENDTILTRRRSANHNHPTSRTSNISATPRARDPSNVYQLPSPSLTEHSTSNHQACRLLQVPVSIALQHDTSHGNKSPMKTFLDTGAQVTIMTYESAKRAGIAHLIDTRYAGHASGVAGVSCRVLGRIPARTVSFLMEGEEGSVQVLDNTPAITVLEDKILGVKNHDGVDMLMGLDILEEWRATLCLEERTLTARGAKTGSTKTVVIPLTQGSTRNRTTSRTAVVATCTSSNTFVDKLESSSFSTKKKDSMLNCQEEEEEEYRDDNYYFIDSEDEFDECDLSGV